MNIRKMVIDDYESVYSLWLSCKGMGLNNIDDTRQGIEKFLNRNPNTCFVYENKDGQIGAVILVGNDGRRGYVYHLAVSPLFRRQGIASKLVRIACDALLDEGINKVALVVFEHNLLGNDFWEKQGFTSREDLTYRNKSLVAIERIDT